jgi:hypothetical protein
MKKAVKILHLLFLMIASPFLFNTLSAAEDSIGVTNDEFRMKEGEFQTFNFLSNDFIFNSDSVSISVQDSIGSQIIYSGNGIFSIDVPIDQNLDYQPEYTRFFRYKIMSISDTLNFQIGEVYVKISADKKNHRVIKKSLLLSDKLLAVQIPLPDISNPNLINTNTTIINKPSNSGKTKYGEYKFDIENNGLILPFFTYLPLGTSGRDTFEITTHDVINDVWDTTSYLITIVPLFIENNILTRWFFKNDISGLDTTSNTLVSSDSIISFCNGDTSGSSIYGVYNIKNGVFSYKASYLKAGLDSLCLRNASGNSTIVRFVTVLDGIIRLEGMVYNDIEQNCVYDTLTNPKVNTAGICICATNDKNEAYYGSLYNSGQYFLTVPDTGFYNIKLCNNPFDIFSIPCDSTVHFTTDDYGTTVPYNVGLFSPYINCSFPVVNISTSPNFRRCRNNWWNVNYANLGGETLKNPYIDITLEQMEINLALDENGNEISYSNLGNGIYRFEFPDVAAGASHYFSFSAYVICDSTANGQTLCAEAHIFPDTICTQYNGSIVQAFATCLGDSVQFRILNQGSDMIKPGNYIVIQDDVMIQKRQFQLPGNQSIVEKLKTQAGKTYRIIADREEGFPEILGDLFTTAAIENCEPVNDTFSTGFINQFPAYDGEPFRSLSCNVIVGSYDPNDKIAFPLGYEAAHYIEANTAINYQINFQNTGTDTAFLVVIVDTIAPELNISTIIPGAASHPFRYEQIDSNVVKFIFEDINLPDSNRNEPFSHGFVKFRIQQKKDLPLNTLIYNSAAIYFDFNAPIITNQTFHTIGKDFVKISLSTSTQNNSLKFKNVSVYPNPFRTTTQILVDAEPLLDAKLLLMDTQGRIIRTINGTNNRFELHRNDLPAGTYLFQIIQDKTFVASGKLVVQ